MRNLFYLIGKNADFQTETAPTNRSLLETSLSAVAGDMWDGIAYKTLGDEAYTDRLMKLNPQYRRTFIFPAGITLTVPEPETRFSSDLPPWKRGTAE